MEKFSIASVLVLNKFCIFILNLSVIFSLLKIKKKKTYKNLEYFIININKNEEWHFSKWKERNI